MILSCCAWALSGPEAQVLASLRDVGLRSIDVRPFAFAGERGRDALRDAGIEVTCVAASNALPAGVDLDSADADMAGAAIEHVIRGLDHAAQLGAAVAYVVPGLDASAAAVGRFARALESLSERAAERGLRLCVEHFPSRALPSAARTLEFVRDIAHPDLYLLLDVGHLLITGEDPVGVIESAADRLGYVHLDDNDGVRDLHLGLLDGIMTRGSLGDAFAALGRVGYGGAVSLELSPDLPDPLDAIRRSRQIVLDRLPTGDGA